MEKLAEDRASKLQHAVSVETNKPIVVPIKKGFFEFNTQSLQKLQLRTVISLRSDLCELGEEPLADQIIYTRPK